VQAYHYQIAAEEQSVCWHSLDGNRKEGREWASYGTKVTWVGACGWVEETDGLNDIVGLTAQARDEGGNVRGGFFMESLHEGGLLLAAIHHGRLCEPLALSPCGLARRLDTLLLFALALLRFPPPSLCLLLSLLPPPFLLSPPFLLALLGLTPQAFLLLLAFLLALLV
jgi:hypothetical protein